MLEKSSPSKKVGSIGYSVEHISSLPDLNTHILDGQNDARPEQNAGDGQFSDISNFAVVEWSRTIWTYPPETVPMAAYVLEDTAINWHARSRIDDYLPVSLFRYTAGFAWPCNDQLGLPADCLPRHCHRGVEYCALMCARARSSDLVVVQSTSRKHGHGP